MIKDMFELVDYPVYIKDEYNNIKFLNNSFKSQFNISKNCDLIKYKSEIKKCKELDFVINSNENKRNNVYNIKGRQYKKVILPLNDKKNEVAVILIDISEAVSTYNEKYQSNILNTVIDNIPELIFYKDKNLRYIGGNKECRKFYKERGVLDIVGKTDIELPIDKEFTKNCTIHDNIVLDTKKPLHIEEKKLIENSNEYQVFETIKTPIISGSGDVLGLVGIVRDVTKQKKIEDKLRYLSYTDELTGLYNRSYFYETFPKLVEKNKLPIGIVSGDVNGLKIINDTLGHTEGDKLLKSISNILLEASTSKDMVFRWGGDEFIVILPNSSDLECKSFIEKVNTLCNQDINKNFKLSIAQGYSLFREGDDIDYVLSDSENKAYREKVSNSKSIRTSILDTLTRNLQLKNIETKEHTDRVYNYCYKLGKYLNLDEEIIKQLLLVAQFHDIGKIGVPENILLKQGKLNEEEYEIMKTHSEKGYRLTLLLPELSHISRGILTHHERWDGKGYPLGLKGEDIPLVARIISVVDAYDAMTHNNIYKKAKVKKEAINELKKCAGSQFDPNIVKAFCTIIENKII